MHDELGRLYADRDFAALFPTHGQPALAPAQLALVTLLQCAENLSDLSWPISPSGYLYAARWYIWWRPPRTGTARTLPAAPEGGGHVSGPSGIRCCRP